MFRYIRLQIVIAAIFVLASAAAAQSPWVGSYEFTEDGGKNAGGSPIVVSHHIDVMDSDKGLVATIRSNGYQTSVDVLCLVKVNGDKATLYFAGYGDDNMFENYNPGQLMLSLQSKDLKSKSEILTHWGAFKPAVPKNEKSGKVYFVKVDPLKK